MFTVRIVTPRRNLVLTLRRRTLVLLALVPVGIWFGALGLQGGVAAAEDLPTAEAARDDMVVAVGGVGRIIQAGAAAPIVTPTKAGSSAGASGSTVGSEAPADAVFPRASGQISRFLVVPGRRVITGQPLALLDDGGLAAAATRQALNDLATARLELRQKRTSDPLNGVRATPAELAAGRLGVTSAREQLARLLGRPRRADVSAAWLEVRRAEAELETLQGGTPEDRAEAIRIARRTLELAQDRLERILAPPDPADVSAATAELRKAEADLASVQRPADAPLPEEIAAARQAVTSARETLEELKAAVPPNAAQIRAAQLDLDMASAELAVLLRPPRAALPEEIAAARQAVEAARAKLARLLRPPSAVDVKTARLEVDQARAELRKLETGPSRAAMANARQAVDSARAKLAQLLGPPLQSDVTASRLDVRRARAELAVLRARGAPGSRDDIGLSQLRVEAAEIRLEIALLGRRLLTVRAPAAGTVTSLLSVPGAPVDTTTPIATVADLDRLAVNVDLSEFDVAQVRSGLEAVVSVDALGGKSFTGEVLFAAPTGSETGGVVTFPVRVTLTRARGLRPGMNVSVRITVAERSGVVQVPLEAVSQDEDEPTVTVIDASGEASQRSVTLGLANNKSVEIVKGLREGERVVLTESQAPAEEGEE